MNNNGEFKEIPFMKKKIILIAALMLLVFCIAAFTGTSTPEAITINGNRSGESASPTQTPYIVYVVVTATPDAAAVEEEPVIIRDTETKTGNGGISLVNSGAGTSVDSIIQSVVATMSAQGNGSSASAQSLSSSASTVSTTNTIANTGASNGGCLVSQADGSTCTMAFEIVCGPTYGNGSHVPVDEVFTNKWVIRNTGTCTWTPDYYFTFDSGWQIGSTSFQPTKSQFTAPGETLNVTLMLTANLQPGYQYYSTYIFSSPNGDRCGTISTTFAVENTNYFAPTATPWCHVQHGRPERHEDPKHHGGPCYGYNCYPWWW